MDITVVELHFTYPGGVEALSGIDLNIPAGSNVAIIGQNGSGKTTLVRHFNGLLQPLEGGVLVGDWDTRQHTIAQLAARVGYVFQNPDDQLFCRTILDEIRFGPVNLGYPAERIQSLVNDALTLTELDGKEKVNPYDLSPTWRKMVTLASILAMDTPILILDEPTTGQDVLSINRIANIVQEMHRRGKTVLTITHDMDFCAENFDRVIVMNQGKIILDGPVEEVILLEEMLATTYVDPPQLTRLALRLGLSKAVRTPDELLIAIEEKWENGNSNAGETRT